MTGQVIPLAERLKDRRAELGISQAQAARELDVARTAYRLWEMEAAKPSPDRWRLIARWLGVSVTTMLLAEELISDADAAASDKAAAAFDQPGLTWDAAAEAAPGDFFMQGRSLLQSGVSRGQLAADDAATLGSILDRLERGTSRSMSVPWESTEFRRQLASEPTAPSTAREAVAFVGAGIPQEKLDDAVLLVSELVTNSVRHAAASPTDTIGLLVRVGRDVLRVEVADSSSTPSRPMTPTSDGGYGLTLVGALATRWGAGRQDGLNATWFELDLTLPGAPGSAA
jgi:transcriptional regulator with XRE-family HTH domain/anti-sigma regulatory factor (Ser/Thr protein kinase)